MNVLEHRYLSSHLKYDSETGLFWWLLPRPKRNLNRPTGHQNKNGYTTIKLDSKPYLLHRLAWFYIHGYWPKEIDQIDRDPKNNRLENLRECSHQQNCFNRISYTTSGVKGVVWIKNRKKWRASIWVDKKNKFIGHFDTLEEAKHAYELAVEENKNEFFSKEIVKCLSLTL